MVTDRIIKDEFDVGSLPDESLILGVLAFTIIRF
jgi:hypothetical protein